MHVLTKGEQARLGFAVTLLLLMGGSLFAASEVGYTLQLGGDNQAASIKAGNYVYFTPGSSADNQAFAQGAPITWDATITASGVQGGGPGAGSAVKGVANFVFDLELRHGNASGPIVNQEVFYSSIHDGGSQCMPSGGTIPEGLCPPCLAGAAFAFSFNVWSVGPGRVSDPAYRTSAGKLCPGYPNLPNGGGPNMNVCQFPTIEPGKLCGMGAGYQRWVRNVGATHCEPGVGLVGTGGLGIGPVVEGQIDTSGLPAGTYTLKLIPRPGTNALRGDLNLLAAQAAFATVAEQLVGDTVTFVVTEPLCIEDADCEDGDLCTVDSCVGGDCVNEPIDCGSEVCNPDTGTCVECLEDSHCATGEICDGNECVSSHQDPPYLVSAWNTIEHGSGNLFALEFPIGSADVKTEPRQNVDAPYWIITLNFSEDMEAVDGSVELGDEIVLNQALFGGAYFVSGTELEIFLMDVPANQTCLSITVSGLRSVATGLLLAGDNDVHIGALYGDVNRNKVVNIQDLSRVKSQLFQSITGLNADCDVNCNNAINIVDLSLVKANLFKSVTCP
ncbi:MAG: hypothetical protein GXY44_10585 [Phycisphaerales bacterium]|nr:hypothetical protein [Phycisphaerales bacterium]